MYWNNLKAYCLFLLLLTSHAALRAQRGGSTYKAHNHLFGPAVGIGIAYGSAGNTLASYKKISPGSAIDFGFNYYYFKSASLSLGTGLKYSISRWNTSTYPAEFSLNPDAIYRVTERQIAVPLEMNWYFSPYGKRMFIAFGAEPGYLMQRDLERRRSTGTDTAFAYRYPQAGTEYSRFTAGISFKAGIDTDLNFSNVLRFCVQWTNRGVFRREQGLSSSGMFVLSAQYFFSE